MKTKIYAPFSIAIAVLSAILVLLGYFFENGFLNQTRSLLLENAVILAAIALIMGVINMVRVHWMQLRERKGNTLYHFTFFFGLIITLLIGGWFGITNPTSYGLYDTIVIPVEASLMAVMAISLTYLLTKIINRRKDFFSAVFLISVLVGLLISAPFLGQEIPFLSAGNSVVKSLLHLISNGAMRGILIGVALGSIATGLRLILGADRPYGG